MVSLITIVIRLKQILTYADDIDLGDRSERDVAEADEATAVGLRLNFSKTKYMAIPG